MCREMAVTLRQARECEFRGSQHRRTHKAAPQQREQTLRAAQELSLALHPRASLLA